MKKILFILFIIAGLGSCTEEIPTSTIDKYSEKLVVNEYFNNIEPFSIQVSVSKDAYKDADPYILTNAEAIVSLSENGNSIPLSYNSFDRVFTSNLMNLMNVYEVMVF